MMLDNTVRVDGKLVREHAAGIGNQSAVLAEYVAKSRKEAGEKIAQQAELAHHFKLDAGQIEALATGKLGTDATGQPITQLRVTDAAGRSAMHSTLATTTSATCRSPNCSTSAHTSKR